MLVLKDFIGNLLFFAIEGYSWMVIIYCIAGFIIQNRYAGWYVFLTEMCEPPLHFIRRLTKGKLRIENLDLSPLILFFGLRILQFFVQVLFS